MEQGLRGTPGLAIVERAPQETIVGSSIQFLLLDWGADDVRSVVARCAARGVELKWFGGAEPAGFTSRYDSWRYVDAPRMPATDRVLRGILDLRLPLTFSRDDCRVVARIIRDEVARVYQSASRAGAE